MDLSAEQIGTQDRYQGDRYNGGPDHRECFCKRQRMKQFSFLSDQGKYRHKGKHNDRHREEYWPADQLSRLQYGTGHSRPVARINVIFFYESKGILGHDNSRVDEHADSDGDP